MIRDGATSIPSGATVSPRIPIACESTEIAVECARLAEPLALAVEPSWSRDPFAEVASALRNGGIAAVATTVPPSDAALAGLAAAARDRGGRAALCVVAPDAETSATTLALAGELGIVAVDELRPLLAVLALLTTEGARPWSASARRLSGLDRARLRFVLDASRGDRGGARLVPLDGALVGLAEGLRDERARVLGETRDVAAALLALEAAAPDDGVPIAGPRDVDRRAVLDVVFGPERALSDPASKAALRPYGVPLPAEELCTSPSRAAAEAARMGFPVRIALASPDLRVWDHPDLSVDGVDHAARVRDVYRQIVAVASARAPDARVLGVTVAASTTAHALLRAIVSPLDEQRVAVRLAFADAHGRAAADETAVVLPASEARIERAIARLAGADLLLGDVASVRREAVRSLGDVLTRLAAFARDQRESVSRVTAHPLALLPGGQTEIREACVAVGDAFTRVA